MTPDANLFAALHPSPTLPHEIDDWADAADVLVEHGDRVLYQHPGGFLFEGDALVYDAGTRRWLVTLQEFTRTRTDWVQAARLTVRVKQAAREWEAG